MDRLVGHDFGPRVNQVTSETAALLTQVERALRGQLLAAGTDFYGRTSLEVTWQAGQIVLVRPRIEQTITPDAG